MEIYNHWYLEKRKKIKRGLETFTKYYWNADIKKAIFHCLTHAIVIFKKYIGNNCNKYSTFSLNYVRGYLTTFVNIVLEVTISGRSFQEKVMWHIKCVPEMIP